MEECSKSILLKLERLKKRSDLAGQLLGRQPIATGVVRATAGPPSADSVRQASQAAAAAAATPAADYGVVLREVSAVADALEAYASSGTLPADVGSVLAQAAGAMAQALQQQALGLALRAREAVGAGDVSSAADAAFRAKEAAVVAMWAACVGGLQFVAATRGVLDVAMRAADEAVQLVETAETTTTTATTSTTTTTVTDATCGTPGSAHQRPPHGEAVSESSTAVTSAGEPASLTTAGEKAAGGEAVTVEPLVTATAPVPAATPAVPADSARSQAHNAKGTAAEAAAAMIDKTAADDAGNGAAVAEASGGRAAGAAAKARSAAGPGSVADGGAAAAAEGASGASAVAKPQPSRHGAAVPAAASTATSSVAAGPSAAEASAAAGSQTGSEGRVAARLAVRDPDPVPAIGQQFTVADKESVRGALVRELASVGNSRGLSARNLVRAGGAKVLLATGPVAQEMVYGNPSVLLLYALIEPSHQVGLFTLLSHTVRHLLALLERPAAAVVAASTGWGEVGDAARVLDAVVSCVDALFGSSCDNQTDPPAVLGRTIADFAVGNTAGLMVKTQLMPALSRLFARMAEAATAEVAMQAASAPGGEDSKPEAEAALAEAEAAARSPAMEGPAARAATSAVAAGGTPALRARVWADVAEQLVGLLMACCERCGHHGRGEVADPAWVQGAMQELRGAIRSSRVLEHAARATALGYRAWSGRAAIRFGSRLSAIMRAKTTASRPLAVFADVLLSGPCMQHFLLLHTVSQLCAVDKGTAYGLSRLARLPSEVRVPEALRAAVRPGNRISLGAGPRSYCETAADLMAVAFHWWARNRARPCSPRALRAVCERAAAAASVSWAGPSRPSGEVVGSVIRFDPGAAMDMALTALDCAIALVRGGDAGDARGLWAPVVLTATAALTVRPRLGLPDVGPLPLLVEMPLPRIWGIFEEAGGGVLPADPGPELAAALSAGYVSCLERTIRAEMRLLAPGMPGIKDALTLLGGHVALAKKCGGVASLMAYGDPTAVGALIATSAKALESLLVKTAPEREAAFVLLAELVKAIGTTVCSIEKVWTVSGVGPQDRRWWYGHPSRGDPDDGLTGPAPAPTAAATTRGEGHNSGGSSGHARNGSDGSRDTPAAAPLPASPFQRLSLMITFALLRWTPLLRKLIAACTSAGRVVPGGVSLACNVAFSWASLAWLGAFAYLDCCEVEAATRRQAAGARSAAAAPDGSGCASRCGSGSGAAVAAAAANSNISGSSDDGSRSWEQWALGPADVAGLSQLMVQSLAEERVDSEYLRNVAAGLLALIVAFPVALRRALLARVGVGRDSLTVLAWLQRALATVKDGEYDDATRHFLELAPAVAAGREPTAEDVARLRGGNAAGRIPWAERLGQLLPPPCVAVAALRQLSACANPGCTSMEGDSEAGQRQGAYCSRECQRAHRRAEERGPEGGGGARARGRGRQGGKG